MKKVMGVLSAAVCLLLNSCGTYGGELSDKVIVNALAVDYEDGKYTLTAGWMVSGEEEGSFETGFFEGRAARPQEASEALRSAAQKPLFFGHNATVVLGEGAGGQRLDEVLRFLVDTDDVRVSASVFYCDGRAGELLRTQTDERSFGDAAQALLTQGAAARDIKVGLYDIATGAYGAGATGYLPVLRAQPVETSKNAEQTIYKLTCDSLALYNRGEQTGRAGGERMDGLLLLKNKIKRLRKDADGTVVELTNPTVGIEAAENGGGVRLTVRCAARASAVYGDARQLAEKPIEQRLNNILGGAYNYCTAATSVGFFGEAEHIENRLDAPAWARFYEQMQKGEEAVFFMSEINIC